MDVSTIKIINIPHPMSGGRERLHDCKVWQLITIILQRPDQKPENWQLQLYRRGGGRERKGGRMEAVMITGLCVRNLAVFKCVHTALYLLLVPVCVYTGHHMCTNILHRKYYIFISTIFRALAVCTTTMWIQISRYIVPFENQYSILFLKISPQESK